MHKYEPLYVFGPLFFYTSNVDLWLRHCHVQNIVIRQMYAYNIMTNTHCLNNIVHITNSALWLKPQNITLIFYASVARKKNIVDSRIRVVGFRLKNGKNFVFIYFYLKSNGLAVQLSMMKSVSEKERNFFRILILNVTCRERIHF